jgi:hypothetical protein
VGSACGGGKECKCSAFTGVDCWCIAEGGASCARIARMHGVSGCKVPDEQSAVRFSSDVRMLVIDSADKPL